MFKKFLNGIIFGAGFGIGFVLLSYLTAYFLLPKLAEKQYPNRNESIGQKEITTVPGIKNRGYYLGSTASYRGDYANIRDSVLTNGSGKIIGKVTSNGEPTAGLRLRLMLNGSVMSQWGTSDSNGNYTISVPYGQYQIDGFDLDSSSANKSIPNKINHPNGAHFTNAFIVDEENAGRGINLQFIDPVTKIMKKNKYSVTEDIVIEWEAYPNAVSYIFQLNEKEDPDTWESTALFDWKHRPKVEEPQINLKNHDLTLKPNQFYRYFVEAKDANNKTLSVSVQNHTGYDFETIE